MTILRADFGKLVDQAMSEPGRETIRPVVEKELLHYDILFALDREGLLSDLVFQGGTSLRLCHGSSRYSEDLDFVGGPDFTNDKLLKIADCLEAYLGGRYGLDVSVKSPRDMGGAPAHQGIAVDRWQVSVVTSPGRPDLPRQRIKFEVANIPAYDPEVHPLQRNYEFLPSGYEDILLRVESKSEILADKLLAFPVTLNSHVRHRDIWDMQWLRQGNTPIRPELIAAKIEDYDVPDYQDCLDQAIERAPEIVKAPAFRAEMTRFLPKDRVDRTFGKPEFLDFLANNLQQTLIETRKAMGYTPPSVGTVGFDL
jgi:predicted nucleotidyltransferase component of viral defense system